MEAISNSGTISAEQIEKFEADHALGSDEGSRILRSSGSGATIDISGVLTDKPSFFARFYGGGNVTYPEITQAIAEAETDDRVETITLNIDSPGGMVSGLFDTLDVIKSTTKPIKAVVGNMALSAAYAIASVADEITASNRATQLGSVGIITSRAIDDSEVTITSTHAPLKDPDASTAQGVKDIREGLDSMHDLFVTDIAAGRNTTKSNVNKTFGRGAVVLADKALNLGMIDSVNGRVSATPKKTVNAQSKSSTDVGEPKKQPKERGMTREELKANHPDVYNAILDEGKATEADRVNAHLELAKGSGDTESAIAAIQSGEGITATIQAKHMSAAMNRTDVENMNQDTNGADAGDETPEAVDAKTKADKEADEIAAAMSAKYGA